jgi:hypothetical protein
MSEWFYIRMAFGLTWLVVAGYALAMHRRRVAAERAISQQDGGTL